MELLKIFTTKKEGNLAYHVNDIKENVDQNRLELSQKLGFDIKKLKYMDQVHGSEVKIVNESDNLYECDAIVTNKKNTPLMVMVADCIPILFFDEVNEVIAAAHAGRNGVFLNITSKTIDTMKKEFGCEVENINIIAGPSIQKCCYEVSEELAQIAVKSFGKEFESNRYIDLQGILKQQLKDAGILKKNIDISTTCTRCGSEDYFSYRADKSCGRFAGIIMLKD